MKFSEEKLIKKGVPSELIKIAYNWLSSGIKFCVIEHYPTEGNENNLSGWLWRIIHPDDDDMQTYTDWFYRSASESRFLKLTISPKIVKQHNTFIC